MENYNMIMQAISTVGFPIVCCGALFWRMTVSEKQHKEEMDKISEALQNNTLAITRLTDGLEVVRKMGSE